MFIILYLSMLVLLICIVHNVLQIIVKVNISICLVYVKYCKCKIVICGIFVHIFVNVTLKKKIIAL